MTLKREASAQWSVHRSAHRYAHWYVQWSVHRSAHWYVHTYTAVCVLVTGWETKPTSVEKKLVSWVPKKIFQYKSCKCVINYTFTTINKTESIKGYTGEVGAQPLVRVLNVICNTNIWALVQHIFFYCGKNIICLFQNHQCHDITE